MLRFVLVAMVALCGFLPGRAVAQEARGPAAQPAARYFCPMKCEGEKTYDAAGRCPVCHMKLKPVPAGPSLTLKAEAPGTPDDTTRLTLTIRDAAGEAPKGIGAAPIEVVMVSRDLSWFVHDRPRPAADGAAETAQKFPPGEYVIFATFMPAGGATQTVSAPLSIPGKPPILKAMGVDADRAKTVEGVSAAVEGWRDLRAGREATIRFQLTSGGRPLESLKPESGSDHLTAVSQDLKEVVHAAPAPESMPASPAFTVRLDRPGLYRLWAEFRHGEKTLLFPFVVEVAGEPK